MTRWYVSSNFSIHDHLSLPTIKSYDSLVVFILCFSAITAHLFPTCPNETLWLVGWDPLRFPPKIAHFCTLTSHYDSLVGFPKGFLKVAPHDRPFSPTNESLVGLFYFFHPQTATFAYQRGSMTRWMGSF